MEEHAGESKGSPLGTIVEEDVAPEAEEEANCKKLLEEAEKEQNLDKEESIMFPPPVAFANANAASSRVDMFAYIGYNVSQNHYLVIAGVGPGHQERGNRKQEEESTWPSFSLITQKSKFTCVSLSQQEYPHLAFKDAPVVTGDAGGLVKIWNVKTKNCVIYHNSHAQNISTSVTCVDWSPRDPNLIVSSDTEGGITLWNVKTKCLKKMKLETPNNLSCFAISPFEDHILALGTLSGNILIVDTSEGRLQTLHKMHHDEQLIKLLWAPFQGDNSWPCVDLETHHQMPLLVSSVYLDTSKQATIRVWDRVGNEVSVIDPAPKEDEPNTGGNRPIPSRKANKTFVPMAWIQDSFCSSHAPTEDYLKNRVTDTDMVLFSTFRNNIVRWVSPCVYEVVHDLHNIGAIFCIIQTGDIIWSFGLESMIVGWNLRSNRKHVIVPTLKGVCCVQASPVEGTQVALGGSDGVLRVFCMKEGYPGRGDFQSPEFTAKLGELKITATAWHPVKDNLIALGTNDGLLGTYEYRHQNRFVRFFDRRAQGTVYALDWGPQVYTKEFEESKGISWEASKSRPLQLYFTAGERAFFISGSYTSQKNSNAPLINLLNIIKKTNPEDKSLTSKVTDLRWSPDYAFLCIGYLDGRIDLHVPPYLKIRCTIKVHSKPIQCLLWRPYDFGPHSLSKWLASASNDGTVRLYNLAPLFNMSSATSLGKVESDDRSKSTKKEYITSSAVTLNGHNSIRVISLSWSPHDPKLLMSVSYDQTAVVWNILEPSNPISRYCGHAQRLVACTFHPSDPKSIITFSDELISDFPVHVSNFTRHPYKELSKCIETKVKKRVQAIKLEREEKEQEPLRLDTFVEVTDPGSVFDGKLPDGDIVPIAQERNENSETSDLLCNNKKNIALEIKEHVIFPEANDFLEHFSSLDLQSAFEFGKRLEIGAEFEGTDITTAIHENDFQNARRDDTSASPDQVDKTLVEETEEAITESEQTTKACADGIRDSIPLASTVGKEGAATSNKLSLIEKQLRAHLENGDWPEAIHLSLWISSHNELIEKALKSEEVTLDLVNIVLTQSYPTATRLQVIQAYVRNLVKTNQISQAVTFLLQIGRDVEAIELYLNKKKFYESYILTKARLPGLMRDKMIDKVLREWTTFLVDSHNYDQAFGIFCSIKDYDRAIQVLEMWNEPLSWQKGMEIAVKKLNDSSLAKKFGILYLEYLLEKDNSQTCFEFLNRHEFLKWAVCYVTIYIKWGMSSASTENENPRSLSKTTVEQEWNEKGVTVNRECFDSLREVLSDTIPQTKEQALLLLSKYMACLLFRHISAMKLEIPDKEYEMIEEKAHQLMKDWELPSECLILT